MGADEYSQSMFLSRNKKNNVYPRKPQLYNIKVGFKGGGSKLYRCVFVMTTYFTIVRVFTKFEDSRSNSR